MTVHVLPISERTALMAVSDQIEALRNDLAALQVEQYRELSQAEASSLYDYDWRVIRKWPVWFQPDPDSNKRVTTRYAMNAYIRSLADQALKDGGVL